MQQLKMLGKTVVALLVLMGVTILHVPDVLKGDKIFQGDKLEFIAGKKNLVKAHQQTGKLPHWCNDMYGGMPANFIYPKYPSNIVYTTLHSEFLPNELKLFFLPSLFVWLALILTGTNWIIALLCALAFGFTTVVAGQVEASHSAKVLAMGTIVPLLVGVRAVFKGKFMIGFLLVTVFTAINLACNHLQITYYCLLLIGLLGLIEFANLARKKAFPQLMKSVGILSIAAIIGVLPNSSMLWSSYQYSKETVRGNQILETEESNGLSNRSVFEYSYSYFELMSTIIPRAVGGSSNEFLGRESASYKVLEQTKIEQQRKTGSRVRIPLFWGDKPYNGAPGYLGVIFFCLFAISCLALSRSTQITIGVLALVTVLIMLGDNASVFGNFMYNHFPMYSKFRAPSMAVGVLSAIMVFAIALGSGRILNDSNFILENKKRILTVLGVILGVVLLSGFLAPQLLSMSWEWGLEEVGFSADESLRRRMIGVGYSESSVNAFFRSLQMDRAAVLQFDSLRSAFIILVLIGLFWIMTKTKLSFRIGLILMAVLGTAELYHVNKQYLNSDDFSEGLDFEKLYPKTDSFNSIQGLATKADRLIDVSSNNPWMNAKPAYYMPTIGGMSSARLRRFEDLKSHHMDDEFKQIRDRKPMAKTPVLNMMNTRFIRTGSQAFDYLENVTALGPAWFVGSIRWASTPNEEIDLLSTVNLGQAAVVSKEFEAEIPTSGFTTATVSSVKLIEKTPYHVLYRTVSDQPQLMVLSEMWYKGNEYWQSSIDDELTDHIRANYGLRAIVVPEGEHLVRFEYHDKAFEQSEPIAAAGSGLLILTILVSTFLPKRKNQPEA